MPRPDSDEYQTNSPSFHDRLSMLRRRSPVQSRGYRLCSRGIYHSTRRLRRAAAHRRHTPLLPRSIVSRVCCFDCGATNMNSFHTSSQRRLQSLSPAASSIVYAPDAPKPRIDRHRRSRNAPPAGSRRSSASAEDHSALPPSPEPPAPYCMFYCPKRGTSGLWPRIFY